MPKGGRGGRRGGEGFTGSYQLPNGNMVEFEGSLRFGGKDAAMNAAERKSIEDFEKKRIKNKVEYGRLISEDGEIIEEGRGGKGSVSLYTSSYEKANVYTHTHPRSGMYDEHVLGGTFSVQDINVFTKFKQKTFRAAAAEGTYSISRKKNFDAGSFMDYYKKQSTASRNTYENEMKALKSDYRGGKIAFSDYIKKGNKSFNSYLVRNHESLLAGQKKYGYTYTLERRE